MRCNQGPQVCPHPAPGPVPVTWTRGTPDVRTNVENKIITLNHQGTRLLDPCHNHGSPHQRQEEKGRQKLDMPLRGRRRPWLAAARKCPETESLQEASEAAGSPDTLGSDTAPNTVRGSLHTSLTGICGCLRRRHQETHKLFDLGQLLQSCMGSAQGVFAQHSCTPALKGEQCEWSCRSHPQASMMFLRVAFHSSDPL